MDEAVDTEESLFLRATALKNKGDWDSAIVHYQAVQALNPNHANVHNNLGAMLAQKGQWEAALACFKTALDLEPDNLGAKTNFAHMLRMLRRYDQAIAQYQELIQLTPQSSEAYQDLGTALFLAGRSVETIAVLRKAVTLRPDFADAYLNLGAAHMELGMVDDAYACFVMAHALDPGSAEINCNLGLSLVLEGRYEEGVRLYDQSLICNPDFNEARWNRSLIRLMYGQFEAGWEDYQARFKRSQARPKSYPGPEWDGKASLINKTIVLYHEQGLGDNIQFVRYAHDLKALGARVVLHVQSEILSLCKSLGDDFKVVSRPEETGEYHYHLPMLCLPRVFKTTPGTIPAYPSYLYAETQKVALWRERFKELSGLKIGIVWRGAEGHKGNHHRSLTALQISSLLTVPGLSVVNLQIDAYPEELNLLRIIQPDLFDCASHITDFSDTAAAMAALDLVIGVDTSVCHTAGAIGVRVWTLIAAMPDWRWMLDREDTPWYPSMRLVRQHRLGDWAGVLERVRADLGQEVRQPLQKRTRI